MKHLLCQFREWRIGNTINPAPELSLACRWSIYEASERAEEEESERQESVRDVIITFRRKLEIVKSGSNL